MTSSHIPESPEKDTTFILEQLKGIAAAVMSAAEAGNTDQVLQRIAAVSRKLVNAKYAALGVPDGKGSLKYFEAVGMTPEQIAKMDHYPEGKGLLGAIMNEREIIRLKHMQADPRSIGFPKNHPKMTSLLGVPIQVRQQLLGMLYLCDREDGLPFSIEDQWLIETLAGYAALAIAGAQLNEQTARITLLEERERVGMELHDGIIQSLYAVGIKLQLQKLSETHNPTELEQAIRDLDNIIEDIRSYILNLRSAHYQQKTIAQSINETLSRLAIPDGLQVEVHAPDAAPMFPAHLLESICQIINEAVSNTVRHANASEVQIYTEQDTNEVRVVVEDNGHGFDMSEVKSTGGLGLRNMRQRVHLNHGTMQISTNKMKGTRLEFEIPTKPKR